MKDTLWLQFAWMALASVTVVVSHAQEDRWAFSRPQHVDPPAVQPPGWARNGIDAFILSKLQQSGLQPAAEASRPNLIRRLYFDLIGLPPTPTEVDTF